MTLPASGTITYAQINTEVGFASTASLSMSWVYSNTKTGQQSYSINNYYSKAWYQRNVDGNCNNGNCNCACDCGNICCFQCVPGGTVNCANCDARAWLQTNCNCACTYNCAVGGNCYSTNCFNCQCGSG